MRLLDLFCGAGGAAMGYHRAGFDEITGVDIVYQKRYPFAFIQADALEYVREHGREFDAIHASPPCQFYSEATPTTHRANHPDLIGEVRKILTATGKPYVIENVEGARAYMINPVMLCGTMFGLRIWRHRYFECHPFWSMSPTTCQHRPGPITVHTGSNTRKTWEKVMASGGGDSVNQRIGSKKDRKLFRPRERVDTIRWAMQIDWMTQGELTEAIPPAYTEFIGRQLIAHI